MSLCWHDGECRGWCRQASDSDSALLLQTIKIKDPTAALLAIETNIFSLQNTKLSNWVHKFEFQVDNNYTGRLRLDYKSFPNLLES